MIKIFILFYIIFSLLFLFIFMEKPDKNIIKLIFKNKTSLKYMIKRVIINRKYEVYETNNILLNDYLIKIIFTIMLIILVLILPIVNLIMIFYGYPYIFGFKYPLAIIDGGSIFYTWIQYREDITDQYLENMGSKIFWNKFFVSNNANTPKVYGTLKDGVFTGKIPTNKKLIWKLVYSQEALGLHKFTSFENAPKKGFYILQELIPMCDDIASHLRIVTVSNKTETKIFHMKYYKQRYKNRIASNVSHGGKKCLIEKNYCKNKNNTEILKMPNHIMSQIDEVKSNAIKLHKKLKSPIIAWDIAFSCDKYYFLEGNIGFGFCKKDIHNYKCLQDYIDFMYGDL